MADVTLLLWKVIVTKISLFFRTLPRQSAVFRRFFFRRLCIPTLSLHEGKLSEIVKTLIAFSTRYKTTAIVGD
ncbi:hypothetical protein HOLleu_41287 [Holothuria leucospilota]|uniref:Uncharacterized protein n=1 Tax=Holothuria leucospilota TaxID=206669 RepID=A0A9Q0YCC5_HOLLE|nr:hypothetical protein HOLleu_41287 [Holothuria leucospilota]